MTEPSRDRAFAALSNPQYRRLWTSGAIVFFGIMAQNIARIWTARELTGSTAGLGGVLLAFGVPMLVATPWGGVAADRFPKRAVCQLGVLLMVTSSAWLALALVFDFIAYWMLLAASGLQALALAVYAPARTAFTSDLVDRRTLPNAITLTQLSAEGSRVAGPALGGILIATASFGTDLVFTTSAMLGLTSLVALSTLPRGEPRNAVRRSPLSELVDGVRYVARHDALVVLVVTSLAVVMLGFPYQTFIATMADEVFDVGSGGFGLMSATSAAGAFSAGLLSARRGRRGNPWTLLVLSGLVWGVGIVVLGAAPSFPVAVAVMPFLGAAALLFQTTNLSLLLALSDLEYHGRMQSLVLLGFSGYGIAALPLGVLADAIGIRTLFGLTGGAVVAIVAAFAVRSRHHRRRAAVVVDLG